jgi:hypothetical protein
MCSGCSGNYEDDSDDWGLLSASFDNKIDVDSLGRDTTVRRAASRTQMRGRGRSDAKSQGPACECQAESEYEVFVSADEIIEIHRIAMRFAGSS